MHAQLDDRFDMTSIIISSSKPQIVSSPPLTRAASVSALRPRTNTLQRSNSVGLSSALPYLDRGSTSGLHGAESCPRLVPLEFMSVSELWRLRGGEPRVREVQYHKPQTQQHLRPSIPLRSSIPVQGEVLRPPSVQSATKFDTSTHKGQTAAHAARYLKGHDEIFRGLRDSDVHVKASNRFRAMGFAVKATNRLRRSSAATVGTTEKGVVLGQAYNVSQTSERRFTKLRSHHIALEAAFLDEEEEYTELEFDMHAAGGYSKRDCEAAKAFDTRHMARIGAAHQRLAQLKFGPTSLADQRALHAGCILIRRNKLVMPESYDPFTVATIKNRIAKTGKLKQWMLNESIWLPRLMTGNSHDFFETADAMHRMLLNDWDVAKRHHNLSTFIGKVEPGFGDGRSSRHDIATAPEIAAARAVEAVHSVLQRHCRLIYGAFEYYSLIGSCRPDGTLYDKEGKKIQNSLDAITRLDLQSVSKRSFFVFLSDCKVRSPTFSKHDAENAFVAVNAHDFETADAAKHDSNKYLIRHEWLQILVRIAVRMYCRVNPATGCYVGSAAEAVDELCHENLLGKLPHGAHENSNAFRKTHCYTAETDMVLRKHKETLRNLYTCYSGLNAIQAVQITSWGKEAEQLLDRTMMNVGEWLHFLTDVGLIEMQLVSVPMALHVFQWSRIRSLDDYSDRSEILLRHLSFEVCHPTSAPPPASEPTSRSLASLRARAHMPCACQRNRPNSRVQDFLEACVRLASVLAMPTRGELDEADCANAAEFLHAMREDAPRAYEEHVARRTLSFTDRPRQRTHVLVMHLIDVILHNIEASLLSADMGGKIPTKPAKEVGKKKIASSVASNFFKYRMAGGRVQHSHLEVDGHELVSAMNRAETLIMDALRQVPAFRVLNDAQLATLRAAMSVAKYEDGERVIDQGDEGHTFFLITTGHAEVLQYDPNAAQGERGGEELLIRLHQSDCFGERALLYNERRAASVRAGPGCRLYVVFIARENFEKALGRPLEAFSKLKSGGDASNLEPPENEIAVDEVLEDTTHEAENTKVAVQMA